MLTSSSAGSRDRESTMLPSSHTPLAPSLSFQQSQDRLNHLLMQRIVENREGLSELYELFLLQGQTLATLEEHLGRLERGT